MLTRVSGLRAFLIAVIVSMQATSSAQAQRVRAEAYVNLPGCSLCRSLQIAKNFDNNMLLVYTNNIGPTVSPVIGEPPNVRVSALSELGSAVSYSDLATGKMGMSLSTPSNGGGARAYTSWSDSLVFTVAGATESTVTRARALISIHAVTVGPAYLLTNYTLGDSGFAGLTGRSGNRTSRRYDIGDTIFLEWTFDIRGPSAPYRVGANMEGLAFDGGSIQALNTTRINLFLPSNVSFTSQSGVFLSQAGGVPEPASWAMLLMGFGAVGGALRIRRQRFA